MKHQAAWAEETRDWLGLARAYCQLSSTQFSLICSFADEARELSDAAGLTGDGLAGSFLQAHILPALAAWRMIRPHSRARIADLGAGAGAFGLTAAIVHPTASVFAIDSSRRHCDFMTRAMQKLHIGNLTVVPERIETVSKQPGYPESFDIAGFRALARESIPHGLAGPLLRPAGALLQWRTFSDMGETVPGSFRQSGKLDLSPFSPRLTLTRYDMVAAV